jgi:hypothetical protein
MYVLNMSSPGVREFCSASETIKVFEGDRTAPLTAATEVAPTADESAGGCTNGFVTYTFRLDAGLYNVVVVGRKSKPFGFNCIYFLAETHSNKTTCDTSNDMSGMDICVVWFS